MAGRARTGRGLIAAGVGLGLFIAGCESAPAPKPGREQHGPTASTSAPTTQPPASQPATTLPTSQPTSQPAAAEPEPPEYLTIVNRFDPQERASAAAHVDSGNRLVIDTRNVQRLRIDREKVPLNLRRSISLQVDGQGLEWLVRSTAEEFERSANGEWTAVKPEPPRKPRKP